MTDPALSLAVPLIAEFEGFRSEPYRDQAGNWTIGFGFTVNSDGTHVSAATPPITREAAEARLSGMVARVLGLVRGMVHVPITNNQAAALTSFAYNEGTNALRNSTLLERLNAGDTAGAAEQFGGWVYADGRPDAGLRNRRARERVVFLAADGPGSVSTADTLNAAELSAINPTPST